MDFPSALDSSFILSVGFLLRVNRTGAGMQIAFSGSKSVVVALWELVHNFDCLGCLKFENSLQSSVISCEMLGVTFVSTPSGTACAKSFMSDLCDWSRISRYRPQ